MASVIMLTCVQSPPTPMREGIGLGRNPERQQRNSPDAERWARLSAHPRRMTAPKTNQIGPKCRTERLLAEFCLLHTQYHARFRVNRSQAHSSHLLAASLEQLCAARAFC